MRVTQTMKKQRPMYGGRRYDMITGPNRTARTGAEFGTIDWAKENKWYLLGGGLLAAAGVAFYMNRH